MALHHDILLLWSALARPRIPPFLHVGISVLLALPILAIEPSFTLALRDSSSELTDRMRYSRLLEENSFSNRRADYVWLLFLCATFLIVRFLDGISFDDD